MSKIFKQIFSADETKDKLLMFFKRDIFVVINFIVNVSHWNDILGTVYTYYKTPLFWSESWMPNSHFSFSYFVALHKHELITW